MNYKQSTALFLVFVLLLSLVPSALAAEKPQTAATDLSARPTDVSEVLRPIPGTMDKRMPYASVSGCTASQLAVWWVNTTELNPYGEEDAYIYYDFPKGNPMMRDNIGLHTIQVDGEWKAAYCIEPGVQDSLEYTTEDMTLEQWLKNPGNTDTLTKQQLNAIGVILLYGQVERPRDGEYDKLARMLATQLMIWEVAVGWREASAPYTRTDDAFIRRFPDDYGGSLVTSYFLDIPEGTRVPGVIDAYNQIAHNLERHDTIPSFTSASKAKAPVLELQPDGKGGYRATVTDQNNILDQYTFRNTENLNFSRKGNTLTVTAAGPIADTVVSCTKQVPAITDQVYYVWHNGSYQQMAACAATPQVKPVPAYFRVTTPGGSVEIGKETSDGLNRSGWKFNFYRDSACTDLISGPHLSDESGRIRVDALKAGTVYVKEVGHQDPIINALYRCEGKNPQKVTVTAGKTASVTFLNTRRTGKIGILKIDPLGNPLSGARFRLDWSEDGRSWKPVTYSKEPIPGSCGNAAVKDGCLVSASDGQLAWDKLFPDLFYRITEVEAPAGCTLLPGVAWEGKLPAEDLTVQLRVVNTPIFTLPRTGSRDFLRLSLGMTIVGCACLGAIHSLKRKEDF